VKDSIGDAHAVTSPGLDYPTGQRLVQAFRAESGLALPFARHCGYVRVDDSLLKNDQTSAVMGILSRFTTLVPSVSTRDTNNMGTRRWLSAGHREGGHRSTPQRRCSVAVEAPTTSTVMGTRVCGFFLFANNEPTSFVVLRLPERPPLSHVRGGDACSLENTEGDSGGELGEMVTMVGKTSLPL
jgi:hypothetical protein